MKLVSFLAGERASYGVVLGAGVLDLGVRFAGRYPDLKALLSADALSKAATLAQTEPADFPLAAVRLQPVIPNPAKIFCIGLNYEDHRLETRRDRTEQPTVFLRYAESQVGHGEPMLRPRESTMFDYEGEIAVIIGRAGRRIPEAQAWEHVAGYSCYNEGSVRDWQYHSSQFAPGKNFFRTGAFGPWMVSADEIPAQTVLTLETRLNGKVMQHADTSLMVFPIPRLIAYCSTFLPLEPGDVLVTGTPGGVGARRTPPVFLQEGDQVEVEVDKVGVLRNTVGVD